MAKNKFYLKKVLVIVKIRVNGAIYKKSHEHKKNTYYEECTMATKKTNYFSGQFLKEEEFRLENEHLISLLREHNKHLHTWGVVHGLGVTVEPTLDSITVGLGVAVDIEGRFIYLPADYTMPLTEDHYGYKAVYVVIRYNEIQTDATLPGEVIGYTKIDESPVVELATTMPRDTSVELVLATVLLDNTTNPPPALSLETDLTLRKASGLKAGEMGNRITWFKVTDENTPDTPPPPVDLHMLGESGANNDSNLVVSDAHIQIKKDLKVNGLLAKTESATNTLEFTGTFDIATNLTAGGNLAVNGASSSAAFSDVDINHTFTVGGALDVTTEMQVNDLNIGGALAVNGDLDLPGAKSTTTLNNFAVNGALATLSTDTFTMKDSMIRINKNGTAATNSNESGLSVFRGGTAPDAKIYWDEIALKWKMSVADQIHEILSEEQVNSWLIGTVMPFAVTEPPPGWLLADGSKLLHTENSSPTIYKPLYDVIGTRHGNDTADDFYLPNLIDTTIRGYTTDTAVYNKAFGNRHPARGEHDHSYSFSSVTNGSHRHHWVLHYAGAHNHSASGVSKKNNKPSNPLFGHFPVKYFIKY